MRFIRGFVLLLWSVLLAGSAAADSVQQSLVFQSLHQSIWGAGASPGPADYRVWLIDPVSRGNITWNQSSPGYDDYVGSFDSFAGAEFGAGARASTHGTIGLWLDLTVQDRGSVDVTYPVTPRVVFPDANSFRAGDTVTIYTSYTTGNDWSMRTTSPQFALAMNGSFELHADMGAKICAFGCGTFELMPSLNVSQPNFQIFTLQPGQSLSTSYDKLGAEATITIPNIHTVGDLDSRSLRSSGQDEFLKLSIDLVEIAFKAAGSPVKATDSKDFGVGHVDYSILSVKPSVQLKATQDFRFDPNLRLTLQFAKPLEYRIGTSGDFALGNSVLVTVGENVQVRYPATDKQPTQVSQTYRLDNTFTSITGLRLTEDLDVAAAAAGVTVPSIEVIPEICFGPFGCTPSLDTPEFHESVGPLFSRHDSLASQALPNVFSNSWQLDGFTPVPVQAFALDPENPIVLIDQQTGATRNLGGGRRQVAYAIDFANGGDVKLSNVHVHADLAGAFGAAYGYKVDQLIACDATTNPGFNGASDQNLLAAGASLDVGAKGRVILVVSVYPKPDPPVYTLTSVDDGTSPLETFVTKSDNSDVLLGPGTVSSANDYVLFGEQWVKLEGIANTFGHVGSNDFIEVKYGNSGIVAGDLRAGRTVRVQGTITADYAISGGIVDVVGQGKLKLSGNIKQGANVPSYTLAAAVPPTPLQDNVWVGDNQAKVLQPGHYGDVTVNANAALTLDAGTYWFHKLSVANGARVQVIGATRNSVINIVDAGEVRIGQGATLRGTLSAPRANVTFEERSRLEGAASARSITMRPGASASYHFTCDHLVDPDCDGSPNCGQI